MVCRCAPVGAGTCAHPRPTPARDARWRHAATHLQASDRHRAVRRGQLLRARRVSPPKASSLHHLQGLWCWEILLEILLGLRTPRDPRAPRPLLVPRHARRGPYDIAVSSAGAGRRRGHGVHAKVSTGSAGCGTVYRAYNSPCSSSVQAQVAPIGKPQTTAANAKAATRPPCVCEMPRCTGKERPVARLGPRPLRS